MSGAVQVMSSFQQTVSRPVGDAYSRLSAYWRKHYSDPVAMQEALSGAGVAIDLRTAQRWWQGETLPSSARLVELAAAGHGEAVKAMLLPALVIGDAVQRARAIQQKRKELEDAARALDHLEKLDRDLSARAAVAAGSLWSRAAEVRHADRRFRPLGPRRRAPKRRKTQTLD